MGFRDFVASGASITGMALDAMGMGSAEAAPESEGTERAEANGQGGQAAETPTGADASTDDGTSDAGAPTTIEYVCDGTMGAGDIALAGGGDTALYTVIQQMNDTVDMNALSSGTKLRLPAAWAEGLGVALPTPLTELTALLGADGQADEQAVKALWDELSEHDKLALTNHTDLYAELETALGLGNTTPGPDASGGLLSQGLAMAQSAVNTVDAVDKAVNPARWARDAAAERASHAVRGFMNWMGGDQAPTSTAEHADVAPEHSEGVASEGSSASQSAEASPSAPASDAAVAPTDNLEHASAWLQQDTRYSWGANAEDWARGTFDCSSFSAAIMAESGYDVNTEHTFVPGSSPEELTPEEAEAASLSASVYSMTIMSEDTLPELLTARMDAGDTKVEEILARHNIPNRGGLAARIAQLPAGPDKDEAERCRAAATAAKIAKLRELVEADDPRTRGSVAAMEVAEIGREVELNDMKPGDMIQTWDLYRNGTLFGHSTQVFEVEVTADVLVDGELRVNQTIVLNGTTDPSTIDTVHDVITASLIGAHTAGKGTKGGADEEVTEQSGGVYVKAPQAITPEDGTKYERVYAGRLSGSRWAAWEPGAVSARLAAEAAAAAAPEPAPETPEAEPGLMQQARDWWSGEH